MAMTVGSKTAMGKTVGSYILVKDFNRNVFGGSTGKIIPVKFSKGQKILGGSMDGGKTISTRLDGGAPTFNSIGEMWVAVPMEYLSKSPASVKASAPLSPLSPYALALVALLLFGIGIGIFIALQDKGSSK